MLDHNHPVIIDFTNQTSPFEQLWPTTHRALLPIIGKPMLVHTLERLRDSGYRHFRIARHLQQPFVKNRLGCGQEWGVTLRYSDLTGAELLNETLMCFGQALYLHGDELLEPKLTFAQEHQELARADAPVAAGPGLYELAESQLNYQALSINPNAPTKIRAVQDYHVMCFSYCQAFTEANTAPGAQLHRSAQSDWKTRIAPDALVGDSCFVGKHCHIGSGAALEGNCVLGNGVYVDKKARLQNCIVLPNTYIGKGVEMQDCVASAQGAVHVSGDFYPPTSRSVLCSTRPNNESKTGLPRSLSKYTKA